MNPFRYALAGLVFCIAFPVTQLTAQMDELESPKPEISDAILQLIPEEYRKEVVALHLTATASDQQKVLKAAALQPDAPLMLALRDMSVNPAGFEFMTKELTQETSPERRSMILKYGIQPHVRRVPEGEQREAIRSLLTRLAISDPDAAVSLQAITALRRLQWGYTSQLAVNRAAKAREAGDAAGATALLDDADAWMTWDGQMNLPTFMRTPPPLFQLVPDNKPIRVLALGDFGTGSRQQIQLAGAMKAYQAKSPFDFGITLGDNFYPNGVASPTDPQWKANWEDLYSPLGISFYATLGNHDYMRPDGPAAEITYSQQSRSWKMPATYYTYTAGPVQFFAIDTIELSDSVLPNEETAWLDTEIAKSKARWKVVYGHYQIYSATRGDEQNLIKRLLPLLRNRVDLYLCGHDHNLQELKPEDGVHFFVSGGGGAGVYPFRQANYPHSIFKEEQYGFTILDANQDELKVKFVGLQGEEIYSSTIHK